MKEILAHKRILIGMLLFAFLVFFSSSLYLKVKREEYSLTLHLKVAEQKTILATIAELTHREDVDSVVEKLIQDCSLQNRERFDSLLSNLSQLRGNDLQEVEKLFDACGNFFSQRKAVMVARLEREYEVYKDLIELLSVVDKKAEGITYDIGRWSRLVALEQERSELSSKLVAVQGSIIDSLIAGESVASETMQLKLVDGQHTREKLLGVSSEITALRGSLLDV